MNVVTRHTEKTCRVSKEKSRKKESLTAEIVGVKREVELALADDFRLVIRDRIPLKPHHLDRHVVPVCTHRAQDIKLLQRGKARCKVIATWR